MSVDQSGGLRMEIGVLYLSHAMLVLAELIVCSTRGFACILAKWFWPTEISLSFTYGSPEASCNKRADTYLIKPGKTKLNIISERKKLENSQNKFPFENETLGTK